MMSQAFLMTLFIKWPSILESVSLFDILHFLFITVFCSR